MSRLVGHIDQQQSGRGRFSNFSSSHLRLTNVTMKVVRFSRLTILCPCLFVLYVVYRGKLQFDYSRAHRYAESQNYQTCSEQSTTKTNDTSKKLILFWTKIFSDRIDPNALNTFLQAHCQINQCEITDDHNRLCSSDALIFHARGGMRLNDLPRQRLEHQRYVLLSKEPPYKTSAIVGHLDRFFNWTATYRLDSDLDYSYFRWRQVKSVKSSRSSHSYLRNRSALAAVMISNCYSHNSREDYLERLQSIIPVTRLGFCTGKKCHSNRIHCLQQLAEHHPFYLAFENSLCRDYATEKYANVIYNRQMIPVVFAHDTHRYIPNSFINARDFSSPEDLGAFLRYLVSNQTAFDSYFHWQDHYELIVPMEEEYLCQLCSKLHDQSQPNKIYLSMEKWLYADAHCQRWVSALNRTIDIPIDQTMDYEDPWF